MSPISCSFLLTNRSQEHAALQYFCALLLVKHFRRPLEKSGIQYNKPKKRFPEMFL